MRSELACGARVAAHAGAAGAYEVKPAPAPGQLLVAWAGAHLRATSTSARFVEAEYCWRRVDPLFLGDKLVSSFSVCERVIPAV